MNNLEQKLSGKEELTNQQTDQQTNQPLNQVREQITAIDEELLTLFSKRRKLSHSVALTKKSSQKPIRDQEREIELLECLVKQGALLGLDANYITHLFSIIIDDSVNQQQDLLHSTSIKDYEPSSNKSIAVLGGKGAYSYLAAKKYFANSSNTYLGCNSFENVLKSVACGEVEYGVIPIENTISGGITEVYDLLLDSNLTIIGEEKYEVQHCLVAKSGMQLQKIKKILGHPQASRQCNKNLSKLIDADINLVSSTAEALERVTHSDNEGIAAIASAEAAELFGLEVLLNGIANQKNNITRFLVVALESQKISSQFTSKISMALSTGQKAGSLAEVLLVFRDADIPLTNLESRPIPNKPWEQMFYLDIEANIEKQSIQKALEKVSKLCSFVKVLGCYSTKNIS
jgi:chorismate mutase/prephenate dehydratase